MITGAEVYWITRFTAIHNAVLAVGVVSLVITTFITIIMLMAYAEEDVRLRCVVISFALAIISPLILLGSTFIPTTKDMCAIKVIPAIVNNEQVQDIPSSVMGLAKEWIEELKPNKNVKTNN